MTDDDRGRSTQIASGFITRESNIMTLFTRSSSTRYLLKPACFLPLGLLCLMSAAAPGHAQQKITIGTGTDGNYVPFGVSQIHLENDYPVNIDFQQIYSATDFSDAVYLDSIAFASSSVFNPTAATYNVTIGLSNTSVGVNDPPLSYLAKNVPDFFSANRGANYTTVFSGSVIANLAANNTFDLVFPTTPFLFDPSKGNLLVDIVLTSPINAQGDVGFLSDDTGSIRRAYQIPGSSMAVDQANNTGGALITQFQTTPAVPEASTTISFGLLLALGMGGLVIARRNEDEPRKGYAPVMSLPEMRSSDMRPSSMRTFSVHDYIGVREAAKKKGIGATTLYRAIHRGEIAATVQAGLIVIHTADFDAYLPRFLQRRKLREKRAQKEAA